MSKYFSNIQKINDYLYDITIDNLDYNYGYAYLDKVYFSHPLENSQYSTVRNEPFDNKFLKIGFGGCSSCRKGNFYGRNYDWFYDDTVSFRIHTPRKNGRYATLGMAGSLGNLTKDFVASGEESEAYHILPFVTLDGINEKGVVANLNVVAVGDTGLTTGTNKYGYQKLNGMMMVRYVIDNFETAKKAAYSLKNDCNIYFPHTENLNEEFHLMIGDENETYILEFVDNSVKVQLVGSDVANPWMTNFCTYGVQCNENGTVEYEEVNKISPHGMGVERWNIIAETYPTIETVEDMIDLMSNKIKYTNSYDMTLDPVWKTECAYDYGEPYGDLTVMSPLEDYQPVLDIMIQRYNERDRKNPITWQSVHSCVYDIPNRTMYLHTQEEDDVYESTLEVDLVNPILNNTVSNGYQVKDIIKRVCVANEVSEVETEEQIKTHRKLSGFVLDNDIVDCVYKAKILDTMLLYQRKDSLIRNNVPRCKIPELQPYFDDISLLLEKVEEPCCCHKHKK